MASNIKFTTRNDAPGCGQPYKHDRWTAKQPNTGWMGSETLLFIVVLLNNSHNERRQRYE
ncbi:MAG: hypothetical protein H6Q53_1607 [Deltaproteobacteria bacterium]|nr:hypothetical protein [Deltaproteobacteria bacterium]